MSDQKNPWKTLSKQTVYQNSWIQVVENQVVRPDGQNGIYGVVHAKLAVGVVAVNSAGEIYLVGQYRYATDRYSWEIIEGGAEAGEAPLDCARRELREEAGLLAKHWQVLVPEIQLSNSFSAEFAIIYLATGLTETEKEPEPTEILQVRKVSPATAAEELSAGLIQDAMSMIALYRLLGSKGKQSI